MCVCAYRGVWVIAGAVVCASMCGGVQGCMQAVCVGVGAGVCVYREVCMCGCRDVGVHMHEGVQGCVQAMRVCV